MHLSILPRGHKPRATQCLKKDCQLLHCPFCPLYVGDYAKVETHLQSHLKTVVEHGGMFTAYFYVMKVGQLTSFDLYQILKPDFKKNFFLSEFAMYTCKLECRKDTHYHCCECGLLFLRKKKLLGHLIARHPQSAGEAQPSA